MIPGLGRSTGEGIGYPLQCSWASLVAQLVKSLPAMQETWVPSLGGEDPLEKGKATHSSILAWRIPRPIQSFSYTVGEGNGSPLQYSSLENSMDYAVHGVAKSWTPLSHFHFQYIVSGPW